MYRDLYRIVRVDKQFRLLWGTQSRRRNAYHWKKWLYFPTRKKSDTSSACNRWKSGNCTQLFHQTLLTICIPTDSNEKSTRHGVFPTQKLVVIPTGSIFQTDLLTSLAACDVTRSHVVKMPGQGQKMWCFTTSLICDHLLVMAWMR